MIYEKEIFIADSCPHQVGDGNFWKMKRKISRDLSVDDIAALVEWNRDGRKTTKRKNGGRKRLKAGEIGRKMERDGDKTVTKIAGEEGTTPKERLNRWYFQT